MEDDSGPQPGDNGSRGDYDDHSDFKMCCEMI